jgi:hypothetical protein
MEVTLVTLLVASIVGISYLMHSIHCAPTADPYPYPDTIFIEDYMLKES